MNDKEAIKNWWTRNPMTYGDTHGDTRYGEKQYKIGTKPFFEQLDQEFYNRNKPLHNKTPFDRLFPYDEYPPGSHILEIGCGMGTMAMNWARHGANITAIDLNSTAVEQTKRRFELYGLTANIVQEDAHRLSFRDNHFDYAYSWGVLMSSPDLEKSICEIMRVIRLGGGFGIWLYNRRSLMRWYMIEYIEGFLHYENQFLGPLELASRYTDAGTEEGNPYAWPVTADEMRLMLQPSSHDLQIRILGTEPEGIFPLLLPGLGMILPTWAKKVWARRFGWGLWIHGHKGGST